MIENPPSPPVSVTRRPRRILFITASNLGDAILSTGLLAHLARTYPDARFTVAAGPVPAPLFTPMPFVERVIPLPKRRYSLHWFDLWRQVVTTPWFMVVDLRASALAWLLPTWRRHIIRPAKGWNHRVRHLGALLRQDPPPAPQLWSNAQQDEQAAQLIPSGSPVLAVGPTTNWIGKQWPIENYITLVRSLTATDGPLASARVAVLSAPNEREIARPLLDSLPDAQRIDLTTGYDLGTLVACLRRCTLYIGNDSGLMHMAAATGIPTLGLFGPSRECHYAPWGRANATIRGPRSYEDIFTAPDFSWTACHMTDLTVPRVTEAITALLRRIKAAG